MEGNIIMDRDLKRSIILDNYQSPNNKHTSDDCYFKINTRNVSCIDNLDIYLKIEDNIIKDISFEGEACVISISSTNILTNLLIGKTKEEGIYLINNYLKMINEEEYDKEVLKELLVFDDTSKQPSRIKCATLSANGIKDYLEKENHS
jgi:nitrogen fixation NifU-like protein